MATGIEINNLDDLTDGDIINIEQDSQFYTVLIIDFATLQDGSEKRAGLDVVSLEILEEFRERRDGEYYINRNGIEDLKVRNKKATLMASLQIQTLSEQDIFSKK